MIYLCLAHMSEEGAEQKFVKEDKCFQIESVPDKVSLMGYDSASSWVKIMAEKSWLISTQSR